MTWKERNYQYTPEERERKNKIAKLRYYIKKTDCEKMKASCQKAIEESLKKKGRPKKPKEVDSYVVLKDGKRFYVTLASKKSESIKIFMSRRKGTTWNQWRDKLNYKCVKVKVLPE